MDVFKPVLPGDSDSAASLSSMLPSTPCFAAPYISLILHSPLTQRRPPSHRPSAPQISCASVHRPSPVVPLLSAALAASVIALSPLSAPAIPPPYLDREHEIVEEVYTLVRKYYIDPTYAAFDIDASYDALTATPLRSRGDTYKALKAFLRNLNDVYTRLLQPEDMERLRKYDVSGVGLLLTANSKGELAVASEPLATSPAGKAGVRRGDVVVAIDGVDIVGRGALTASEMMQGDDGSEMTVGLRTAADDERRDVLLVRQFTNVGGAPVVYSLASSRGWKVGYVKLADFSAGSRGDVEKALVALDAQGADSYILDLRHNPGGVFEGALEIAGLFEGRDEVVARVTSRGNPDEVFRSSLVDDAGRYVGGAVVAPEAPVALVVDSGSASSSEVLSGGLRDSCRATVAGGGPSYGKGLIQGVFGLSDGSGLVVTVAQYRTPNGDVIQGRGLAPDVKVSDGLVQNIVRKVKGSGPADGLVDFDEVLEKRAMCLAEKVEAAKSNSAAKDLTSALVNSGADRLPNSGSAWCFFSKRRNYAPLV